MLQLGWDDYQCDDHHEADKELGWPRVWDDVTVADCGEGHDDEVERVRQGD